MQLDTHLRPGRSAPIVEVAGEIDVESAPCLQERIGLIMRAHSPCLALDLAGVTFIDCSGVNALLAVCRTARTLGGSIWLAAASTCVRRLVRITRLEQVLGVGPAFPSSPLAVTAPPPHEGDDMQQLEAVAVQPPRSAGAALQNVELRHLRDFVAIADAGSFTGAAERMFITQPTLSQQLRRLEDIIGTRLLHRRREGVRLTTAGAVLLGQVARRRLLR